jgi:hypothetical protein
MNNNYSKGTLVRPVTTVISNNVAFFRIYWKDLD